MSGPKHYNFPTTSTEEAAGIYAQLSSFRHGVSIRVGGNELQFTVPENVYLSRSQIEEEINNINK